jgi:hypothetical protein
MLRDFQEDLQPCKEPIKTPLFTLKNSTNMEFILI